MADLCGDGGSSHRAAGDALNSRPGSVHCSGKLDAVISVKEREVETRSAPAGPAQMRLWPVVIVALVLRIAVLTLAHTYRFPARDDHFSCGWETGRLARSIALGEGFSSPFHGHTGPSAWIAPLYPYFLAGIFKIFGIYSNASAWVALAVNSLCSALTCVPLYSMGRALFGERAAKWTAWIWALLPYSIYWAIRFAWETSFATLMLACAFWLAMQLARENRLRWWLEFSLAWALIALSNPSILAFLPFCGIWILHRQRRAGIFQLRPVLYSGALLFALLAPWTVRNYAVFHKFVFIRGNLGAELRLGNGPAADGQWMFWFHPSVDPFEFERYRQMGEAAYVKARQQEALAWIAGNPARFVEITLKRIFFYWFGTPRSGPTFEFVGRNLLYTLSSALAFLGLGIALRRRMPAAWLFLLLLLAVPMIYYVTFTHPRYRHPVEPEMLLLMVYIFTQTSGRQHLAD